MTTLDTLIAVRALIERRENWCQRALRDGPAFCIRGAIIKVVGIKHKNEHESAILIALAHALPADFAPHDWPANRVVDYNNTYTHAEILAVVDHAIATERRKHLTDISALTALLDSTHHEPELELTHG